MSSVSRDVVQGLKGKIDAAVKHEQITRERVERLEQWAAAFSSVGFWRRLRWLLRGR